MEKKEKSKKLEELDVEGVATVVGRYEMLEFVEFVRERQLDGRKLQEVTEGIIKLWRPKVNAKKFILFIQELKANPEKYLEMENTDQNEIRNNSVNSVEAQYQTVTFKKSREHSTQTTVSGVEEILRKIVPAKSFLYRNQPAKEKPATSYVPMDGTTKKPRRFFRLSSYEYPHFDLKQLRFSRNDNFNDRGYYSIKTNSRYYIQKTYRNPESKPKYKSLSTAEELDKYPDDHFYEDLNYSDIEKEDNDLKEVNPNNVKPYKVKIQELFQSFKLPFFKRNEEFTEGEKRLEVNEKPNEQEKDKHIYENSDSNADMYDSVHVHKQEAKVNESEKHQSNLLVEEYLEPVLVSKDYCDVGLRQREESILGFIISLFESRFGRRDDKCVTMCWWVKVSVPLIYNLGARLGDSVVDIFCHLLHCITDVVAETNDANHSEDSEEAKGASALDVRADTTRCPDERKSKTSMADRPLPVPVENEPYYMAIDRGEAENLLRGHPDGTFVLRPSSQPNHAYTLTVSCSNGVHNVGVRRRPDGRLSLGFARRGERSFCSVTSLLRHHRRRRLLLVAGGSVCGATTLNETPQYYQTPSNLPLAK